MDCSKWEPGDVITFTKNETIAVKAASDTVESAETLVRFAAHNMKVSNAELFKVIKEIHPELKEWSFTFDNKNKTVILRYKE